VSDLKNLELRGRVWWVHRRTPDSLRDVIGKHTLRRSLGTRDLAEAQRLRPLALADFARQLEEARKAVSGNTDPIATRAAAWQAFVSDAVDPTGRPISKQDQAALLALEQEQVALAHGRAAAKAFATQVAAGRNRPLDAFLADFQAESRVKKKTKADQRMALRRLMAWKPELRLETLTRQTAGLYATKGLTHTTSAETKNKHISCLRAYWSWMLKRGKLAEDPWKGQSFARHKTEDGTADVPK
jgi:hypothetical protein